MYALTFMRTEILYLENTISPLNDCVYYNSSSTEVGRKYTETRIPLSSFQAQASSGACMVLDRIACFLPCASQPSAMLAQIRFGFERSQISHLLHTLGVVMYCHLSCLSPYLVLVSGYDLCILLN